MAWPPASRAESRSKSRPARPNRLYRARASGPQPEAEKALGCASLGFGDNLAIGGRLASGVRVECILSEVSVEVDGKPVVEKGHLVG